MEEYEEVETLGKSRTHQAVLAIYRDSKRYFVLKKYPQIDFLSEDLWKAMQRLSNMKHPNLIAVETMEIQENSLILALEYAENRGLRQWLAERRGSVNEAFVVKAMHQLASVLAYLHSEGIVHAAVRLKNIFLFGPGNDLKLGDMLDFPLVPPASSQIPPTSAEDIKDLGLLLYELCTYDQSPPSKEPRKGSRVQPDPGNRLNGSYSNTLMELIKEMTRSDSQNRPSAVDILNSELLSWLEPIRPEGIYRPVDPQEDYVFPPPTDLIPRKSPLAQQLQEYLVTLMGLDKFTRAYCAVLKVAKDPSQPRYIAAPYRESLRTVLENEEITTLLPLLKLLHSRDSVGN